MSLFRKKTNVVMPAGNADYAALAEMALNEIAEGVMIVDANGIVKFCNPAAARMTGFNNPNDTVGLDYKLILKFETIEGQAVAMETSVLAQAFQANEATSTRDYVLISRQGERGAAIALSAKPTGGLKSDKLVTFRDITKELEDEQEQSEFISTASHEMRTPVASIEGYLGLALNPATATIDARAQQYLTAAHAASQHLGRLFKDLLDVTKSEDNRLKAHMVPVDIVAVVREMVRAHEPEMQTKHLKFSFGTAETTLGGGKKLEPLVYASVDLDFMREILDNLIENAIKYTPDGGEIWVNARGDGDKVLINVTDTGIGVSPEDASHLFQKFYRVDNSQTRQIGGTGLGLYLVKQRTEAMGGRVWVESAFGEGSTFFVSLPRLSDVEYEQQRLAYQSNQAVQAFAAQQRVNAGATQVVVLPAQTATPAVTPAASVAPVVASQPQVAQPVVASPVAQPVQNIAQPIAAQPVQIVAQPVQNVAQPVAAQPAAQPVAQNVVPVPPIVNQNKESV